MDLRPAIEELGIDTVIRQMGKAEVIRHIGPREFLDHYGVEEILANLPAAKRRELERQVAAKKARS
jgi:hypothetical protein